MATTFRFLIRDGLEKDIEACMALDHTYRTERVWQMSVKQDASQRQVMFKTERLPRVLEAVHTADERRLRLGLPADQCFLVAVRRDEPAVLGYLTMHIVPTYRIGLIQDIVVSRELRRRGMGRRLLTVARQWAQEHDLHRLIIETRTRNYPGIQFCQAVGFSFCGFNDQYFPDQDIAVFFGFSLR